MSRLGDVASVAELICFPGDDQQGDGHKPFNKKL